MNKDTDHSREEQPPQAPSMETPKETPAPKDGAAAPSAGSPRQLLEELDKMARSGDAAAEAPAPPPPQAPMPDAAVAEETPAEPLKEEEAVNPAAEEAPSAVPPPEEPAVERGMAVPEAASAPESLPDKAVDPVPAAETGSPLSGTAAADVPPAIDMPSAQPEADVPAAAPEPATTADELISDAMKQLDGLLQELKARPSAKDAGDDSVG